MIYELKYLVESLNIATPDYPLLTCDEIFSIDNYLQFSYSFHILLTILFVNGSLDTEKGKRVIIPVTQKYILDGMHSILDCFFLAFNNLPRSKWKRIPNNN